MNIDSQQISLMRELVEVQEARKANWPTPDGPADKDAEAVHRAKISAIRNKLSARRVSGPENTPAADGSNFSEGLEPSRRATFLRLGRWVRKAFRSRESSKNVQADLPPNGQPDFNKDVTGG